MRSSVRFSFVALLVGVIVAFAAPAAAQAAFGVEKFFAANCKTAACEPADVTTEAFTQAGGHPPAGITDFTVNNHVIQTVPFTAVAPDGLVTHVRTDVAPGVSTNPRPSRNAPRKNSATKNSRRGQVRSRNRNVRPARSSAKTKS